MIPQQTPTVNPPNLAQRTLKNHYAIPRVLWPYRQFVAWKFIDRGPDKKPDKCPVNCRTLGNAGSTWPNTWSHLPSALACYDRHQYLNGIGFVLAPTDQFTMVDADECVQNGLLNNFARTLIERLGTYTELSPSGRGLRFLVRDVAQRPALKRPQIEIYSTQRFATLTGDTVLNVPIADVNLGWLYAMFPKAEEQQHNHSFLSARDPIPQDDLALWERIFKLDKQGPAHQVRFNGDLAADNGDPSLAVIRLLNCLARWTDGDAGRMDRMIRQSHLDPSKFDDKRAGWPWIQGRILDAINYSRRGK